MLVPDARARLRRLLEYQARVEEEAKCRVQMLHARLERAQTRLQALREACEAASRPRGQGAVQQGAQLARTQAYLERVRRDLQDQQTAVRRAELELQQAREQLTAAAQSRLATERLLAREDEASHGRQQSREQQELDERARLRHA